MDYWLVNYFKFNQPGEWETMLEIIRRRVEVEQALCHYEPSSRRFRQCLAVVVGLLNCRGAAITASQQITRIFSSMVSACWNWDM